MDASSRMLDTASATRTSMVPYFEAGRMSMCMEPVWLMTPDFHWSAMYDCQESQSRMSGGRPAVGSWRYSRVRLEA